VKGCKSGARVTETKKLCRISILANPTKLLKRMAPQAGFEPATLRLTA
jgi:hypothetical protein